MRLLWWIALVACVIWMWRDRTAAAVSSVRGAGRRQDDARGEAMLACACCGLHFPASEAVVDASGAVYCGEAHRQLGGSR